MGSDKIKKVVERNKESLSLWRRTRREEDLKEYRRKKRVVKLKG